MSYQLQTNRFALDYTPETSALTVTVAGSPVIWSWANDPFIVLSDGKSLSFSNAACESREFATGVDRGVRATYRGFTDGEGTVYPYVVETRISVNPDTGFLKAEARLEGDGTGDIAALAYPPRMKFDAPEGHGYTVLPRMQGAILPAGHSYKLKDGLVFERDAYIPVYGQVNEGCTYAAIIDTPFDARYSVVGDEIQPWFVPSLGQMRYARGLLYAFFAEGDFNTIAKTYRAYLTERGELVTLKEKIVRNPNVEYLLGCPIVHTCAAVHIHPASHFYDPENPENNDSYFPFTSTAEQLRELKEKGADKAYLHLDGWGHHGYDNLHPDPFPVHEASGGAEGLKALKETCHELGYFFGIHDQYRDYYYDAPSFDLNNAVTRLDGSHPYHDYWFGGPHSFLCAKLAVDYVRRNYDEFERLDLKPDGSYLDVFSVVELDECFHPEHPMTRKDCAEARAHCLNLLTDRGIIPSSEETIGCMVNAMALCHHAPFYTTDWEDRENAQNIGIPIPFFNLVYHDCIIIPWYGIKHKGAWGIAGTDRGFYWALLCGGTIYYDADASAEDIAYGKVALELHRRVALCELTSHEFLDGNSRRRRSTFSDGTVVEADFDKEWFVIRYPDGTVVEGN